MGSSRTRQARHFPARALVDQETAAGGNASCYSVNAHHVLGTVLGIYVIATIFIFYSRAWWGSEW